jgi:hypothetical protein
LPIAQVPDAQSVLVPQPAPSPQNGEQPPGVQRPPVQTPDPQSFAAPQKLPRPQWGEHAGAWHTPFAQTLELQSVSAPHALLGPQLGAQLAGWQKAPLQRWLEQSEPMLHGAPCPQLGEHVAHFPSVHTPERQSLAAPQGLPFAHVGAQLGAAHLSFVHTIDAQSPLAEHPAPSGHTGAHAGGAHLPLVHTPEAQSVSVPQTWPSMQTGEHMGAAHTPSVQFCEAQSRSAPHGFSSGHLGEHAGGTQRPAPHSRDAQSSFVQHASWSVQSGAQWAEAHMAPDDEPDVVDPGVPVDDVLDDPPVSKRLGLGTPPVWSAHAAVSAPTPSARTTAPSHDDPAMSAFIHARSERCHRSSRRAVAGSPAADPLVKRGELSYSRACPELTSAAEKASDERAQPRAVRPRRVPRQTGHHRRAVVAAEPRGG